ncbi:unnamed protein product [Meganyctiphanes norvegica]|uniref:Protein quiver n=1 Tax=Meganyctiphanes norvegica TaxID=48144 RepID=A0AAV2PQ02_MEGNR
MKFLICATIYLLNLCVISLSIECYVCNSYVDEACNDPFNSNSTTVVEYFLMDCNNTDIWGVDPLCRKVQTYVWNYAKGAHTDMARVQRECGYKRRTGSAEYVKREEDYQIYVTQCDTDGCNSAPQASASSKTALLLVPLFTYRYARF